MSKFEFLEMKFVFAIHMPDLVFWERTQEKRDGIKMQLNWRK